MNERIRQLAKQAGAEVVHSFTDFGIRIKFSEQDLKKFAELIVGECMRMCDVAQMGYLTHGLEKEASGAISVKQYIEEHFGVEE